MAAENTPSIQDQMSGLGNLIRTAVEVEDTPIAFYVMVGLDGTVMADSRVPQDEVVYALRRIADEYEKG